MGNLTPTSKDIKTNQRQSQKSHGIYDLLGKNMKKKEEIIQKKEDDFFEYVMRFSYRTKKGSIPSNPGKVNQDSHVILPNINNKTWQHFFAVCDGHGPLGHFVSSYIKNILPVAVSNAKNLQSNPNDALMKAF